MLIVARRSLGRRSLCAAADAWSVFALPANSSKSAIRLRYLELAKETHPDANPDAPEGAFLTVQQAFEELMAAAANPSASGGGGGGSNTSRSSAARGGGPGRPGARRAAAPLRTATPRPPTLGEILCGRLEYEPSAYGEVWEDVMAKRLEVTAAITCAIFKACARSGAGMPAALAILRDAQHRAVMTPDVRATSIASLLTLCKEEGAMDATFEVVDMITDEDRTPEVLAALSSTFSYFPSGASF